MKKSHKTLRMLRKPSKGFTLIELMITVAIVGILASIAYPSFVNFLLKGKRSEGRQAVLQMLQEQERYMTQNNTYKDISSASQNSIFKNWSGDSGFDKANYKLKAEACGDIKNCVQVSAVPTFDDPDVGTISMTSRGVKSCSGTKASLCWK